MRHETLTMDQLTELRGSPVYSRDGEKIGSVEEIFYDADTRRPEWIGIGTGFLGMKRVLVPVVGASMDADGLTVPYAKATVKETPDIDGDEVSEETERALYAHYGLSASDARSDSTYPDAPAAPDVRTEPATIRADQVEVEQVPRAPVLEDGTIIRAEEELAVGKRSVETGRVRLRKWVEAEPVRSEVRLERETAYIERVPVNQVVSGVELGEGVVEITLHGEEAVVAKRVVARERVGLERDVEQRVETISDTVRREHVEFEDDTNASSRPGDTTSGR